jgi:hypothetical protein
MKKPGRRKSKFTQARKGSKGALHYQESDVKDQESDVKDHEQHCLAAIEMLDH